MIRFLQTGDLHITEGPRFEDDRTVIQAIVESGKREVVDFWIVAGDLTGTTVPHRMTPKERNLLAEAFQKMTAIGPVVIVYGNHDFEGDLDIFSRLDGVYPIKVVSRPEAFEVVVGRPSKIVRVFALPYPSKRFLLQEAVEEGVEGQKATAEGHLRAVLGEWRVEVQALDAAANVFVSHLNIGGSVVAGGEVMIGNEIELSVGDLQDLEAAGMDYLALSHIHKAQEMTSRAFFAGSPTGHNFGETDPKGWNVVTINREDVVDVHVERVPSPARRFVTVDAEVSTHEVFRTGIKEGELIKLRLPTDLGDVNDAEVKLRVSIPEEWAAAAEIDPLLIELIKRGAYTIKVERIIIPMVRVRSESVAKAETTREAVEAYLRETDEERSSETVFSILTKYDSLAARE